MPSRKHICTKTLFNVWIIQCKHHNYYISVIPWDYSVAIKNFFPLLCIITITQDALANLTLSDQKMHILGTDPEEVDYAHKVRKITLNFARPAAVKSGEFAHVCCPRFKLFVFYNYWDPCSGWQHVGILG